MFVEVSRRDAPSVVPEDYLSWRRAQVGGRGVVYGVGGGDGPPVVFLHGWGLGSRAYKRAIRRLTNRGCRVFAPALPSFGGTAGLPRCEMDMGAYARWVAAFMAEVGIDEPALVIGHSFGGGVAIKLARERPELVRYLIVLNAIGSGNRRPPWQWAVGLGMELWPISNAPELIQSLGSDLVSNLLHDPWGLFRVGLLAFGADLKRDMAEVKKMGVPVLVLTSDRDRLIPRSAFATVCDIMGADSRVVSGKHAWLLVDPDSFGDALASTIDVQVAQHEASHTADRKSEIAHLVEHSHLSRPDVHKLLESAAPLWLLSESATTLAGDLLLCRPALKKNEVRAVARPIEGSDALRLTIVTRDRPGLLADSAAVLTARGLSISSASASTWKRPSVALHSFILEGGAQLSQSTWDILGERLRTMVATGKTPQPHIPPLRSVMVDVQGVGERLIVKVVAPDVKGLLASICRFFAENSVNIETLRARTQAGVARDTFLVVGAVDATSLRDHLEQRTFDPRLARSRVPVLRAVG